MTHTTIVIAPLAVSREAGAGVDSCQRSRSSANVRRHLPLSSETAALLRIGTSSARHSDASASTASVGAAVVRSDRNGELRVFTGRIEGTRLVARRSADVRLYDPSVLPVLGTLRPGAVALVDLDALEVLGETLPVDGLPLPPQPTLPRGGRGRRGRATAADISSNAVSARSSSQWGGQWPPVSLVSVTLTSLLNGSGSGLSSSSKRVSAAEIGLGFLVHAMATHSGERDELVLDGVSQLFFVFGAGDLVLATVDSARSTPFVNAAGDFERPDHFIASDVWPPRHARLVTRPDLGRCRRDADRW